jgi:hypothetical protein
MSNDLLVSLLAATDLFGSFSADELAACAVMQELTCTSWSKVGSGWQSPPRMGAS